MHAFFANPNVQHFLKRGDMLAYLANAVAVDYLRKMNVDERQPAMRWLQQHHPAIHAAVITDYPHHAA